MGDGVAEWTLKRQFQRAPSSDRIIRIPATGGISLWTIKKKKKKTLS